jgi:hypothetical protein
MVNAQGMCAVSAASILPPAINRAWRQVRDKSRITSYPCREADRARDGIGAMDSSLLPLKRLCIKRAGELRLSVFSCFAEKPISVSSRSRRVEVIT